MLLLSAAGRAYDSLAVPMKMLTYGSKVEILVSGAAGRTLIRTGDDSVRLADLNTGKVLKTMKGDPLRFMGMQLAPDGSRFALGYELEYEGWEGGITGIQLFDAKKGDSLGTFLELTSTCATFHFTPDSRGMLASLDDGRVFLLDSAMKAVDSADLGSPAGESQPPNFRGQPQMRFAADGSRVLIHTKDSCASLLALPDLALLRKFDRKAWNNCRLFDLSPDGSGILAAGTGTTGKNLYLDALTGNMVWDFSFGYFRNNVLGISPDGKLAFTTSDTLLKVWDLLTGAEVSTLQRPDPDDTYEFATFSSDSKAVIASDYRVTAIWDAASGRRIWDGKGRMAGPLFRDAGGTDRVVHVMGNQNSFDVDTVRFLRITDGAAQAFHIPGYFEAHMVAFSPGGTRIYGSGYSYDQVWSFPGGEAASRISRSPSLRSLVPDSRAIWVRWPETYFITDLDEGTVKTVDRKYGKAATFSGDLKVALLFDTLTYDSVHVEKMETGGRLGSISLAKGTSDEFSWGWLSRDGGHLVAGAEGGDLKVFDTRTGRAISSLKWGEVPYVVFSPVDGVFIVRGRSGSYPSRVLRLSDTLWKDPDYNYSVPTGTNQYGIAFSPDGSKFAIGNRIHATKGGKLLMVVNQAASSVVHANFSPDGTKLVLSSATTPMQVWDLTAPPVGFRSPGRDPSPSPGKASITLFSAGQNRLRFSLPPGVFSRVELYSLAGKRRASLPLPESGQGMVSLPESLPIGLYAFRLLGSPSRPAALGKVFIP